LLCALNYARNGYGLGLVLGDPFAKSPPLNLKPCAKAQRSKQAVDNRAFSQ
jgi:hypothetical protein